jgi:hypothetical protein
VVGVGFVLICCRIIIIFVNVFVLLVVSSKKEFQISLQKKRKAIECTTVQGSREG